MESWKLASPLYEIDPISENDTRTRDGGWGVHDSTIDSDSDSDFGCNSSLVLLITPLWTLSLF